MLAGTHTRVLPYQPTVHLYPLVDLQPNGDLISIYSESALDAENLIRAESPLESTEEGLLTNRAEHVVPQSWFGAKQPMRGDLHHLFTCERNSNSSRDNTRYWEFGPEERAMEDRGRSERAQDKFAPNGGKSRVAPVHTLDRSARITSGAR